MFFFLGIEMMTITARHTRTRTSNNYKPYKISSSELGKLLDYDKLIIQNEIIGKVYFMTKLIEKI